MFLVADHRQVETFYDFESTMIDGRRELNTVEKAVNMEWCSGGKVPDTT